MVYLTPARNDLTEIVKFHINKVGVDPSRKIYTSVRQTVERLSEFPLMGQTHPDPLLARQGYRKLVLTKTYVAIYKIIDATVYIYRIVNGQTDYPKLLK